MNDNAPTADDLMSETIPGPTPEPASSRDAQNGAASQPAEPTPPETPNPFAGQRDKLGREFHPAKFRIKDGKPQVDSLGRFVPLGLGGGKRAESTPEAGAAPESRLPPEESAPVSGAQEITAEIGVEVAIGLIQTALITIGEDEGVLDDMEKAMLRAPLLRVLTKYNLTSKMTPEMEAAAAIAVIVMRRIKKPKTMGWFQSKLAWLFAWWKSLKVRRAVPEPIPVSASV